LYTISGTGLIDQNPKETVVKMAKWMLGKNKLCDEDFESEYCFSTFMAKASRADELFKQRSLIKPTVRNKKSHQTYAPMDEYDCILFPKEIKAIREFINDRITFKTIYRFFNKDVWSSVQMLRKVLALQKEEDALNVLTGVRTELIDSKSINPNSQMDQLLGALITRYRTVGAESRLDMN
jgi:hypothetical protein